MSPQSGVTGTSSRRLEEDGRMHPMDEGELPLLDERLRRVGEWLLVGYTVAMVLVTFVLPERHESGSSGPGEDPVLELFVG
jgi:hypothetical protein